MVVWFGSPIRGREAMLDLTQFRSDIVRPILEDLELWSAAAENLLVGTALVESGLFYVRQLRGGPALGLFQMEPATHNDIWRNCLAFRNDLRGRVERLFGWSADLPDPEERAGHLVWNAGYAAAMCRIHYLRVPAPLPEPGDVNGLAVYWKAHYNTPLGAGTAGKFERAYVKHLV